MFIGRETAIWSRRYQKDSINASDLMAANCQEASASAWRLPERSCKSRAS
jgi:hypothetical protein